MARLSRYACRQSVVRPFAQLLAGPGTRDGAFPGNDVLNVRLLAFESRAADIILSSHEHDLHIFGIALTVGLAAGAWPFLRMMVMKVAPQAILCEFPCCYLQGCPKESAGIFQFSQPPHCFALCRHCTEQPLPSL
jgi:hypothetical protein